MARRTLVFYDKNNLENAFRREVFSEFENANIPNPYNVDHQLGIQTFSVEWIWQFLRKFKFWYSNGDKFLDAMNAVRNSQIVSNDKSLKAVLIDANGLEKQVMFKDLFEFAQNLPADSHKLIALGERARFQFLGELPVVKQNLINYDIPIVNDDLDTSKWKILEVRGSNVLFEVDTMSACLIWKRKSNLFLGDVQFSLALVVDE